MPKEKTVRPTHLAKEFDKALYHAAHFGFIPIECPKVTEKDEKMVKDCLCDDESTMYDASEKAAFLRTYLEKNFGSLPHPLAVAWKKSGRKFPDYSLELVGFAPGIAEALLIRTALSILFEEGREDCIVLINSIGDKDSINSYERELNGFARKHFGEFGADLKKKIKKDVFDLVRDTSLETESMRHEIPSSIASLTSSSRSQFKEVLEYLEALGVEFRLAPELLGNKNFCTETVFSICSRSEPKLTYAVGYKYSRLGKRFGFKKDVSFIGMTVYGEGMKEKKVSSTPQKIYTDLPKPKFYLVQLGRDAKMKAIPLIDHLRSQKIAIHHYLGRDKITSQLATAENLRVSHILIIGQKEALDNTVTIRNMNTRAQTTVPSGEIAVYLKNIEL